MPKSGKHFAPLSRFVMRSANRDAESLPTHSVPGLRASSVVEAPDPAATIVKADESLSFTATGKDVPPGSVELPDYSESFSSALGTHVQGLEQIMQGMDVSSKAFQNLPEEHLGHRSFALWSGTNGSGGGQATSHDHSSSSRGGQMSTLAASTAPRGSSSGPGSMGATGVTMSGSSSGMKTHGYHASPSSSWAPPGVVGFPQQHPGGPLGTEDLKIFNVLDRGRDSAVYQGIWRGTAVAVSVVSVKLGPRSCRRVLGAESIVATNLDHPNVVATYVYDSVEQPPEMPIDGRPPSSGKGSGSRAFAIQELCNGGSLRSALRRGILSPGSMQPRWPSVLRILCGIAAGMDHMHTLRVYHGALSPSNILFKYTENARSLFGALRMNQAVAKVTGYTSALRVHRVASEADRFSTFYAAPDAPSWPRLSPAADVFSFGVIMWELMNGILVYQKPKGRTSQDDSSRPHNAYSLFNLGRRSSGYAGAAQEAPDSGGDPDNLSHHPDYPNLPLHAPLTYALAMQACLSPNATERPTFRQLVSLLDDLASEVGSGKYIDSSGNVQQASAVEQAHMSASAPPSRAAITRNSSSEAHQHRLRSGFHNVFPSLSVAGTILEEGEDTDEYNSSVTSLGPRGSSPSEHATYAHVAAARSVGGSVATGGAGSIGTASHASPRSLASGSTQLSPVLPPVDTVAGTAGISHHSGVPAERFSEDDAEAQARMQTHAGHAHANARKDSDSLKWADVPTSAAAHAASAVATGGPVEQSAPARRREAYSVSLGNVGDNSGRLSDAQGSSPSHGGASDVSLAQLHHNSTEVDPPLSDSAQAFRPSRAYSGLQPPHAKSHLTNVVCPWQHHPQPLAAAQSALEAPPSAASSNLSPTAIEAALAQSSVLQIQPLQRTLPAAAAAAAAGAAPVTQPPASGSGSRDSSSGLQRALLQDSPDEGSSSSSMWAAIRDRLQNSGRFTTTADTIAPDTPPRSTAPESAPMPATDSSDLAPASQRKYPATDPMPKSKRGGNSPNKANLQVPHVPGSNKFDPSLMPTFADHPAGNSIVSADKPAAAAHSSAAAAAAAAAATAASVVAASTGGAAAAADSAPLPVVRPPADLQAAAVPSGASDSLLNPPQRLNTDESSRSGRLLRAREPTQDASTSSGEVDTSFSTSPQRSSDFPNSRPSSGAFLTTDGDRSADEDDMHHRADSDPVTDLTFMYGSALTQKQVGVSTGDTSPTEASDATSARVRKIPTGSSTLAPAAVHLSPLAQPATVAPTQPQFRTATQTAAYPTSVSTAGDTKPVAVRSGQTETAAAMTFSVAPVNTVTADSNTGSSELQTASATAARTPDGSAAARVFTLTRSMESSLAEFHSRSQQPDLPDASPSEPSASPSRSPRSKLAAAAKSTAAVPGGIVTELATRTNRAVPAAPTCATAPVVAPALRARDAYAATLLTAQTHTASEASRGSAATTSRVLSSSQSLRAWTMQQPGASSLEEKANRDREFKREPLPPGEEFVAHLELQPPPNFCLRQWGSSSMHSQTTPHAFSGPDPMNPIHKSSKTTDTNSTEGSRSTSSLEASQKTSSTAASPTLHPPKSPRGRFKVTPVPKPPALAPPNPWRSSTNTNTVNTNTSSTRFGSMFRTRVSRAAAVLGRNPPDRDRDPKSDPKSDQIPQRTSTTRKTASTVSTSPSSRSRSPMNLDANTESFMDQDNNSGNNSVDLSDLSGGGWSSRISVSLPGLGGNTTEESGISTSAGTGFGGAATAASVLAPTGGRVEGAVHGAHARGDSAADRVVGTAENAAGVVGNTNVNVNNVNVSTRVTDQKRLGGAVVSHMVSLGDLQFGPHRTKTVSQREAEVIEDSKDALKEGSATAALKRFQDAKQAKLRMQERNWEEKVMEASTNDREFSEAAPSTEGRETDSHTHYQNRTKVWAPERDLLVVPLQPPKVHRKPRRHLWSAHDMDSEKEAGKDLSEVAAPRYESGSGVERSSPQQKLEAVHPSRHSVTEGTRGSLPVSLGENAFRI